MPERHKILLLDDEQDLLELYKDVLEQLPSRPEITTSNSGARAIALLESELFTMLITDLNMPKMDGLQVLSIVRRKFPHLRIVIMTSVVDEQFRSRAYAMGVDLYWEKPANAQEIKLFLECVESLLGRESHAGFRGVQSKSLVDIIQLECLSQSSSVLKIINGPAEGKIWVQDGELIDAQVGDMFGEEAFRKLFGWRTGNFEILPPEPTRERKIFTSYQGLLLDTAQALDEAQEQPAPEPVQGQQGQSAAPQQNKLTTLSRFPGVECLLEIPLDPAGKAESWGLENPEALAAWCKTFAIGLKQVGDDLNFGELMQTEGFGLQRHVGLVGTGTALLCAGFDRSRGQEEVRETLKNLYLQWAS